MKKISFYLFIAIIFAVFVYQPQNINAGGNWGPTGDCWRDGAKIPKLPFDEPANGGTYKDLCTSSAYRGTWQATGTPPPTDANIDPPGECWQNGHNTTAGVDHVVYQQCLANHGCWRKTGDPLPPPPCGPKPTETTTTTTTQCKEPDIMIRGVCTPPKPAPDVQYSLLSPLPCTNTNDPVAAGCVPDETGTYVLKDFKPGQTNPLGAYLNLMIKIVIGLAAVMAVTMIVIGGLEYMASELISGKEAAKTRIWEAVLGLLLALGAYALLNTINPDLLKTDLEKLGEVTVTVTLDSANFAKTEQTVAIAGTGYKISGASSRGVSDFVTSHLDKGETLRTIKVDTKSKTAYFYVGAEGDWSKYVAVPINIGFKGFSEPGQAKEGDFMTPKMTTTISSQSVAPSTDQAVVRNGYNFGAAFVKLNINSPEGKDRGIGFHGRGDNSMGTTNGCIRMSNDDLKALAPYMKPGVQVIIE